MEPASPTEIVTVKNRGENDSLLQLGVMAWRQADNDDKLEPTRDILANPTIFLVKGGDQQIARLGLRVSPTAVEASYRLVLQEVPRQRQEFGLSTVLRVLIPVFIPPTNAVVGMEWQVRPGRNGMQVVARNTGTVHVQIKTLKVSRSAAETAEKTFNMYVLPGAVRVLELPAAKPFAPGAAVQLQVDSDQGLLSANVRVGSVEGVSSRN